MVMMMMGLMMIWESHLQCLTFRGTDFSNCIYLMASFYLVSGFLIFAMLVYIVFLNNIFQFNIGMEDIS